MIVIAMPQDSRLSLVKEIPFRSINHKIYIRIQIPEIIPPNLFNNIYRYPPNLLHREHNLTCDGLLMLPGTITGPIVVQQ